MSKKEIIKLKEQIERFEGYSKERAKTFWEKETVTYKRIVELLENDEMTPEIFSEFTHRQKWDTTPYLKSIFTEWVCENCKKSPTSAPFPFPTWVEERCDHCDHLLTERTGGGQNDPFGWSFKKSLRHTRDEKIKKIIE